MMGLGPNGNLYNVGDLTGDCVEHIPIDTEDRNILDVVEDILTAARNVSGATLECDIDGEMGYRTFYIAGSRQLTEHEREWIQRERDRNQRYQEHMRSFRG